MEETKKQKNLKSEIRLGEKNNLETFRIIKSNERIEAKRKNVSGPERVRNGPLRQAEY